MKTRKFIGGFIALLGLTAAVSVADGSAHETLIRFGGVAMFIVGALVARVFDFQNDEK